MKKITVSTLFIVCELLSVPEEPITKSVIIKTKHIAIERQHITKDIIIIILKITDGAVRFDDADRLWMKKRRKERANSTPNIFIDGKNERLSTNE